ncbi:MAG: DNA-3-methyladenine glycosylase [Candidatus Omnitrophota bacterium]
MKIERLTCSLKEISLITGTCFDIKKLEKNKRNKSFFRCGAQSAAKELLGDYLVLKDKKITLAGRIVETEGYIGIEDDASHSFGGRRTKRNQTMYNEGGCVYAYFIYGKFWCFNVVTSKKDDPQAVLIRAIEPVEGLEVMKERRGPKGAKNLTNGPCRWTQAFAIDKAYEGRDITCDELFISRGLNKKFDIVETTRVGIDYAVNSKDWLLRFYIKGSSFISKK